MLPALRTAAVAVAWKTLAAATNAREANPEFTLMSRAPASLEEVALRCVLAGEEEHRYRNSLQMIVGRLQRQAASASSAEMRNAAVAVLCEQGKVVRDEEAPLGWAAGAATKPFAGRIPATPQMDGG